MTSARLTALDVFRGVVVMLLVPDVAGGFSFYAMATQSPTNEVWARLAGWFTHVEWAGASVWDLVMPGFVFSAGASLALSTQRRRERGDTSLHILAHVLVRAFGLVTLGMLLTIKPSTHFEEVLPYLLLACSVPWGRCWPPGATGDGNLRLPLLGSALAAVWLGVHLDRLGNYDFNQILVQIGLATVPAFLLMGRDVSAPLRGAAVLLVAWTAAFLAYPAADRGWPSPEPAWFAHWDRGRNLGEAFDLWFLNLLPRSSAYAGNSHGYHTLTFIPLAALMLVGAAAARSASAMSTLAGARRLALAAAVGGLISVVLALTVAPLIKSLWTITWTVFCASLCTLAFASLLRVCPTHERRGWSVALTLLGGHALLLYVVGPAKPPQPA